MTYKHIDWTTDYELGIEDIDFQHHYFLNLINRLSDELTNSTDAVFQAALISELNAYVRFHFKSEENMMLRAGYPQLDEHRAHHRSLIDKLSYKESQLSMGGSGEGVDSILNFLGEWFMHHTAEEDRLFADFLQQ